MSELDLNQKLDMRKAFWALGASTRIDVKLSALVPTSQTKSRVGAEEWTDLDVLAMEYVPIAGLVSAVADCKTTKGRATERVFWLKGVADLFGARAAYMTKETDLPPSARQLALRLGISTMDKNDRAEFVRQAGETQLPRAGGFLGAEAVRRWEELISSAPGTTDRLQRYRRAFYWVFPRHRNLVQLPAYLEEAAKDFETSQRWAQALLVDLSWFYLLTALVAVDEVTKLHLAGLDPALRQVVVGSEQEMREKEALKQKIRALIEFAQPNPAKRPPEPDIVPAFFPDLVDLVARLARRRAQGTEALRVLEFTGVETIANRGASWQEAFPNGEALGAKLASDVVRFLCRAVKLDVGFVDAFDASVSGRARAQAPAAEKAVPVGAAADAQPELFRESSRESGSSA